MKKKSIFFFQKSIKKKIIVGTEGVEEGKCIEEVEESESVERVNLFCYI